MMVFLLCTLFCYLACLITLATPKRVEYNFNVGYILNTNPDGRYERQVIGINGQFPPPKVEVNENDTIVMHVHNSLDQPTTIHAHGIFQNGTVGMDGVSQVTQCPIPPGQNMTYTYQVQQVGTYWYHGHFKQQYMDGLRAPLIVHALKPPHHADEDVTITLTDWYWNASEVNREWYLSINENPEGKEPAPQSALINDSKNTSFHFLPNKTYRLRVINVSGYSTISFSLDDHELEVIELDGVDTESYKVKAISVAAAQRVSVLVRTKNSTDTNYYMHADMDTTMYDYIPDNLIANTTAPVYYNESSIHFARYDNVGMNAANAFDDIDLVPLIARDAVDPDVSFNMTVEMGLTTDGLNRAMFNRVPMIFGMTPTLYTLLTTGKDGLNHSTYGPQGGAYIYKHLDMIQLVINNFDYGPHPFHLHGHQFQIVARGKNGPYNETGANDVDWHLKNPSRRDTVVVPGFGYVIIRYRADNPGVWLFHCHISWHLSTGLAAAMIEAPEIVQQTMSISNHSMDQCSFNGLSFSGNAAGKQGSDLYGAPRGIYLKGSLSPSS